MSKRWGGRAVLTDVQFGLERGRVAWIGGPNGAGKTTLLRIGAGLIAPDSGTVSLLGLSPDRDRRGYQRSLGWLPAGDRGLYARLTAHQNLAFWAKIALVPRQLRRAAIEGAARRFGLQELLDSRVDRLSMGQRQRLRLAMAFAHAPDVVLLDEPDTSLDEEALDRLGAALDDLTARGGAAIWCSPGRERPGLRVDRAYVLEGGRPVPER